MKVKELIEQLQTFDEDLPVIVLNEFYESESSIERTRWEFDGYCKIIINQE